MRYSNSDDDLEMKFGDLTDQELDELHAICSNLLGEGPDMLPAPGVQNTNILDDKKSRDALADKIIAGELAGVLTPIVIDSPKKETVSSFDKASVIDVDYNEGK